MGTAECDSREHTSRALEAQPGGSTDDDERASKGGEPPNPRLGSLTIRSSRDRGGAELERRDGAQKLRRKLETCTAPVRRAARG